MRRVKNSTNPSIIISKELQLKKQEKFSKIVWVFSIFKGTMKRKILIVVQYNPVPSAHLETSETINFLTIISDKVSLRFQHKRRGNILYRNFSVLVASRAATSPNDFCQRQLARARAMGAWRVGKGPENARYGTLMSQIYVYSKSNLAPKEWV